MLDFKTILVKRYALGMSGGLIAKELKCSKAGVNKFLSAFARCEKLRYPLPQGITNEAIYQAVYGHESSVSGHRDATYELPDFEEVHSGMRAQNMTLLYQWGVYKNACLASSAKPYSYRQFCDLYQSWCERNGKTSHFEHVPGQVMEIDFAGKTFPLIDPIDGTVTDIVVFVAVLPYSQYVYAEGMVDIGEQQWIEANNNALEYFGGAPMIVVCDNCKQAVIHNKDWIAPELNKDFAEWAEHNGTAIMAAKVRRPKYKPSVEGAVGIMESGFFHDLERIPWYSLEEFNFALRKKLELFNAKPFEKKEHSRAFLFSEERKELLPLPEARYQYAERREATVSSDFHIRFDNAYYSCPHGYVHRKVTLRVTASTVEIFDALGARLCAHKRAERKGQWVTDPSHLPPDFNSYRDWSPDFFERRAALVGPSTLATIKAILLSKKYQVQTYRSCKGVLGLGDKYGKDALESVCQDAVRCGKTTYGFVKNAMAARNIEKKRERQDAKNAYSYLRPEAESSVEALMAKTSKALEESEDVGNE